MEEVRLNHLLLNLNYKSMKEGNPLNWKAVNIYENNYLNKIDSNILNRDAIKLMFEELGWISSSEMNYSDKLFKIINEQFGYKAEVNLREKYSLKIYNKGIPSQEVKEINFMLRGVLNNDERKFLINKLKGFYRATYVFAQRCYSIKHYYSNSSYLDIVWNYSTMFKFLQLTIDTSSDSDDYADKIRRAAKMGVKITHPK